MNPKPVRAKVYLKNPLQNAVFFYREIQTWSQLNYEALSNISDQVGRENRARGLQATYKRFLECFVEDYKAYSEIYYQPDGKRGSMAMHIFVELCRTHFYLVHPQIVKDRERIVNPEEEDEDFNIVSFSMKHCKSDFWYLDDPRPILVYSQSEIMDLILLLSRRILEMPHDDVAIQDFEYIFHCLYTRNSILFCETCTAETIDVLEMQTPIEDDDEMQTKLYTINRDYIMFCTILFNAVMRRQYYYRILKGLHSAVENGDGDLIRQRVSNEVVPALGIEGFEDLYASVCDKCFEFPGDIEWFRYKYPERNPDRGPVLDCLRPEQAKLYFSSYRITPEPVISAAGTPERRDHTARVARTFVLYAIDQWLRASANVFWLNAVMIDNEDIETSQLKIYREVCPCLLQVLGDYWVYSKGRLYPSNDVFYSVYLWFNLLKTQHNSTLIGTDMSAIVDHFLTSISNRLNQLIL